MKKSLLLMLFLALTWCWTAKAVTQTFDFSSGIPSGWITSDPYPWVVAIEDPNGNPITGIKSSNSGVGDSNSMISATFTFLGDGSITFHAGCWGEGTSTAWDKCIFIIDGTTKFQYGALQSWDTYSYDVDAGEHTFTWNYSKDGSVNSFGDAFFLDNVVVDLGVAPACPKPTGLTVNLTPDNATIADLSWTVGGAESAWVLEYGTASDFTGATSVNVSGTPIKNLTGLTPETTYYARVKADCGGDDKSDWSSAVEFTPTNSISLVINRGTNTNSQVPLYGNWADNYSRSQFIIPADSLAQMQWGKIKKLTFHSSDASKSWGNAEFDVCLKEVGSTTLSALEDWSSLTTVYHGSLSIDGNKMVISFNNNFTYMGGNLMIGINQTITGSYSNCSWYGISATGASMGGYGSSISQQNFLPKVTIDYIPGEAPSCLPVSELVASDIQAHSAVLDWTAGQSESEWKLYYKKASADDFSDAISVASKPYTLEGLDAATAYQFKVVAVCSETEESSESAISSFITACDAITTFPWNEDFESYSAGDFADPCWVNEHISGNGSSVFGVSTSYTHESSTKQLYLPDMNSGTLTKLMLPEFDLPNDNYQFVLDVYRNASGTSYTEEGIRVFASQDGEIEGAAELAFISRNYTQTDGNLIPAETASGWYTYELPIVDISGTCYIILRGESKYGSATYMDNFIVKEIPSCLKPTELAVNSISTNSAELSWNANSGETEWKLFYKKAGDENFTEVDNVTDNPYTLENLDPASVYQFYVKAVCGASDESEASDIAKFVTACDAINTLPWSENFDSYSGASYTSAPAGYPDDELPICWQFLNRSANTSEYPQVFISSNSGYPVSGNCLFFKSSVITPLYAILPEFVEDIAGLQLTFTYRNESVSESNGTLHVGYMTDPADASTFASVLTCPQTTALTEKEVLFNNAPSGSYIAFKYQGGSYDNYYLSIDNVSVELAPSCLKPSALQADDITTNSAEFSWTPGASETQWQYACVAKDADPVWSNENIVSVASASVSGLNANSSYDFYVRAYCDSENQSEAIMLNFRTDCEAFVVDADHSFFEGFEDATFAPFCWDTIKAGSYSWSRSTSYKHSGSASASSGYYGDIYLILPDIQIADITEDVLLTFWSYNSYVSDYDKNSVVLLDGVNETELWTPTSVLDSWEETSINLNAYKGQTISLAFKYEGDNAHGWYIDDVSIRSNISIAINASRYATYYNADDAYIMPEGLVGHIFNATDKLVQKYVANNVVPAGVPLVLEGNQGNYQLIPTLANGVAPTDNDLIGNNEAGIIGSATDGYVYYVLSMNASNEPESVGFYYMLDEGKGGFSMPAHKAYLKYAASSAPARFYLFNGENGATWLENLQGVEGTVKFMHEGNIYILRDSIIYDATGRKVRELK